MTSLEMVITIGIVALTTMLTRAISFFIFPKQKGTQPFINFLGKAFPAAVMGMFVIYALKDTPLLSSAGVPTIVAVLLTIGLHLWKRNIMLSIAVSTIVFMILQQTLY